MRPTRARLAVRRPSPASSMVEEDAVVAQPGAELGTSAIASARPAASPTVSVSARPARPARRSRHPEPRSGVTGGERWATCRWATCPVGCPSARWIHTSASTAPRSCAPAAQRPPDLGQVAEHVHARECDPHDEAHFVDRQQRSARAGADQQQRHAAREHDDRGEHHHRGDRAQECGWWPLAAVARVVGVVAHEAVAGAAPASRAPARRAAARRTGAPRAASCAGAGSSRRSPRAARSARRRSTP